MRRLLTALLLLMSCATLWAADNAVILTPGTGVTMRTVDVGAGVQSSAVILGSTAGAAIYGTAGTANANVLTIQGIASGTVVPVTVSNANANGTATEANSSPVVGKLTPTGTSVSALTDVVCGSAASSCVLKASAGNFYGVYAECSAACWLMVFNATSAPSNGATTAGKSSGNLVDCVAIPANDQRGVSYTVFPVAMSVGITAAISSTTCATLTLATTGFIHGTVQ